MPDMIQINRAVAQKIIDTLQAAMGSKPAAAPATQSSSGPGAFSMPFGKHKGRTLDSIGSDAEGLSYLDWLIGQDNLREPLKTNLETFMADGGVQKDLNAESVRSEDNGDDIDLSDVPF